METAEQASGRKTGHQTGFGAPSPDGGAALKRTPLHDLHCALGAAMAPFAGYDMPVHYPMGIMAEHRHTRARAGLFDVSHMGQARLVAPGADRLMEQVTPGDILGLAPGRLRYTFLTTEDGGIHDDLMVTCPEAARDAPDNILYLVLNAAYKDHDVAVMMRVFSGMKDVAIIREEDRALLALQGPIATDVLAVILGAPGLKTMPFMSVRDVMWRDAGCRVSRCGYTGEDGFEISVPADRAEEFARALLAQEEVELIGLGARDSLRLEAGLCLSGQDIDETTSPVEAGLIRFIPRRRREEGGYPGADVIRRQLKEGVKRRRVGILPEGRAPARSGVSIVAPNGDPVGIVTSGGFGPSVGQPVAMGYVADGWQEAGTEVQLMVRGRARAARIVTLPFVEPGYYRGGVSSS